MKAAVFDSFVGTEPDCRLHNELNQLNGRRQEKQQSLTLIDLDLRDAEEKLAALVKAPDARMEVMRRIKPHTLEACSWLEKNRNLFRVRQKNIIQFAHLTYRCSVPARAIPAAEAFPFGFSGSHL